MEMPPESRNTFTRAEDAARQDILDFYMRPASMTSGDEYAAMLAGLPNDIGALVHIVQGLTLHEHMAPAYGVTIPEQRRSESHIRRVDRMLERLLAEDARPLTVARSPQKRLVGVCHHFMLLLVAMLRAKGIPARGRRGFGTYFNPGYFEDHVVCEYWNAADARWIRLEPQSDEVWRKMLKIDFDPLDVPPDRFLIAADAWVRCRARDADPSKFGIFKGDLRGLWFIAGSLVHDVAALNKMEMLQWDVWGAMPRPDEPLQDDQLAFFDRLAALTRAPDSSFAELCNLYEQDDRLRVPATVFNAVLNRPEAI
jgi:Transglutaminase-like superfamily